jgi:hypothetical protein
MPFDNLTDRLKLVADSSLVLCRKNWGATGLKKEEPINSKIGWRPTFFVKPNPALIVAVEVDDAIFPDALKGAAHDIGKFDFPISVYQACSLDVYQRDPKMSRVNLLRENGFGLITVDEDGAAVIRDYAQPLAQYISQERLEIELKSLTPSLKVRFKTAHATYQTSVGQGLQEAGQIIEGLVRGLASQAQAANIVSAGTTGKATADMIDRLYATKDFERHRAVLGGTRSFVKNYRNIASHPPQNPKQAAEKIRKCKEGFLFAVQLSVQLRQTIADMGYQVRLV